MYPVNDYLIVEEVTDTPAATSTTAVLYKPPTDAAVRKYRVMTASGNSDYPHGMEIWAKVQDVVSISEGHLAVKVQDLIARNK